MRSETKTKKAARADQVVDGFMKYGGEGMRIMMVMQYNLIWKTSAHLGGGEK